MRRRDTWGAVAVAGLVLVGVALVLAALRVTFRAPLPLLEPAIKFHSEMLPHTTGCPGVELGVAYDVTIERPAVAQVVNSIAPLPPHVDPVAVAVGRISPGVALWGEATGWTDPPLRYPYMWPGVYRVDLTSNTRGPVRVMPDLDPGSYVRVVVISGETSAPSFYWHVLTIPDTCPEE